MSNKRYLWVWFSDGASHAETLCWQRFIRTTQNVSASARFLEVANDADFTIKRDALERAGWQIGRRGNGWMQRVIFLTKEKSS